ncbi:hypothetical protein ACIBI4_18315 [Streptomyces sp. NPDC050418]|uniref:hypothetical protein n=1 Tax=Streptomyces sp. NPDC050418 TaxID=3365612 RepID=UPI0037BAB0BD
MTYRRAVVPALTGGLVLAALLWWAGASAQALHLPGGTELFGPRGMARLQEWLAPWAYEVPERIGQYGATSDAERYRGLYETGMQIRYGAVFAAFVVGALVLMRRLPPADGRRFWASYFLVWAWCAVAGVFASAASAPWLIASYGNGSYRFLPQLAGSIGNGLQIVIVAGIAVALVTVVIGAIAAQRPVAQNVVPARAARWAAALGTLVVAVSVVGLSYDKVVIEIQERGAEAEAGELLRRLLLLGLWAAPGDGDIGTWLLLRLADVALLAVVWWVLRILPGLLTRATLVAMTVGAIGATVLGLLVSQLVRALTQLGRGEDGVWLNLSAALGERLPAALTFGFLAGLVATLAVRVGLRGVDPGVNGEPVGPGGLGGPVSPVGPVAAAVSGEAGASEAAGAAGAAGAAKETEPGEGTEPEEAANESASAPVVEPEPEGEPDSAPESEKVSLAKTEAEGAEPEPEAAAEAATPEVSSAEEPDAEQDMTPETEADAEAETEPEPAAEPEPVADTKPEPDTEPNPEPAPDPDSPPSPNTPKSGEHAAV